MVGNTVYGGLCETFAENAYGTKWKFYYAIDGSRWQQANNRIHKDLNPPAGALVYSSSSRWDLGLGHVAISAGSGQVFTTLGYDQLVSVEKVSWLPGYLGWAYAPTSWGSR